MHRPLGGVLSCNLPLITRSVTAFCMKFPNPKRQRGFGASLTLRVRSDLTTTYVASCKKLVSEDRVTIPSLTLRVTRSQGGSLEIQLCPERDSVR